MRRLLPHLLLAFLTVGALVAVGFSTQAPRRDRFGVLPATSVPWGSVGLGWGVAIDVPNGSAHHARTFILVSPEGQLFRLGRTTARTIAAWSSDGRLVLLADGRRYRVVDLRGGRVVGRVTLPRAIAAQLATSLLTGDFVGDHPHEVAWSYGARTTLYVANFRTGAVRTTRLNVAQGFESFAISPSGSYVAASYRGGVKFLSIDGTERSTQKATNYFCDVVKWTSQRTVLASCGINDGLVTRLYEFTMGATRPVAVTPVPNAVRADGSYRNGGYEYGFTNLWRVSGQTFVHWTASCGPGGNERVVNGRTTMKGLPAAVASGDVLGASLDALYVDRNFGECMPRWRLVRYEPSTGKLSVTLANPRLGGRLLDVRFNLN